MLPTKTKHNNKKNKLFRKKVTGKIQKNRERVYHDNTNGRGD